MTSLALLDFYCGQALQLAAGRVDAIEPIEPIQGGETFPLTYYPLSDVYTKKPIGQGHRAAREALAL